MSRIYVFNRRTVEDQRLYVRADGPQEAWELARANKPYDTGDPSIKSVSYRRMADEEPEMQGK